MINELILRNYNMSLVTSPLHKIAVVFDEDELFEFESNRKIHYVEDERLFNLCVQEFSNLLSFPHYKFKYEEFKIVQGEESHKDYKHMDKLKLQILYFEDGEPFNKGKFLGVAYQHDETGAYRLIFKPNDKSEWVYNDWYKNKYSFAHITTNTLKEEVLLKA